MLQIFFCFFFISILCIIWGLPFSLSKAHKQHSFTLTAEDICICFFVGLAAISLLASWVALFLPVRFEVLLLLTVPIAIAELLIIKKAEIKFDFSFFKKLSRVDILFFFTCILLFSFLAIGKPAMQDSDLYHIQSIQWIHKYGTVPGLANLYLRYGLYSNWFHAISIFQTSFSSPNFLSLNYTYTLWMLVLIYYQYKVFAHNKNRLTAHFTLFSFCTLLFMLLEWDLFRVSASSTSYDFPVTGNTLICLYLLLKRFAFNENIHPKGIPLLILLISTCFYKLTGVLIVSIWLAFYVFSKTKIKFILTSAVISIIFFLPFAYKNYLQSGYLFFPYQLENFFHPDWKVPAEMVTLFNRYIYLSNIYINPGKSTFFVDGLTFLNYKNWFHSITIVDRALLICAAVSICIYPFVLKRIYKNRLDNLFLYYSCVVALLFWFISSPDTRFAFGLLIFVAFFPITAFLAPLMKSWMYSFCIIITIIATVFYIYEKEKPDFEIKNFLLTKQADIPPYTVTTINGINYTIPHIIKNNWNSRCYNCPLPCIYEANPFLKPRGKTIEDGFRMDPKPDSLFMLNYRY